MSTPKGTGVMKTRCWTVEPWRGRPFTQQTVYPDAQALADVEAKLRNYPPLGFAGEARRLRVCLKDASEGKAFLLQGGDLTRLAARISDGIERRGI